MAETNFKNSSMQPLTNFHLNETNYRPWARAVRIALGGRSKLGYVTGDTKAPEKKEDPNYQEWIANDLCVMSWLFNAMEPQIYEIFAYAETSKELWNSLQEMYGQTNNSSRVFELQQNLSNLRQGVNQSFTDYLGKMKKQWEELRQYRPIASTTAEYVKREEQDKIFQLLANLTTEFEDVRREILMRAELPSLTTVCSIIHHEETRKRVMNPTHKVIDSQENSAHYSSTNSKSAENSKWNKEKRGLKFYCDHCRRTGHTKERCYVLHPHLRPARNRPNEAHVAINEKPAAAGSTNF